MSHETMVAESAHHAHAPGSGHGQALHRHEVEERRPWTVLGLMLAAQFMVILDVSVVNVALPSIGKALSFRDRKSTRLNSSHSDRSRMPSSA